ncbi:hypothetical protein H5410_029303 [Solanum commersonii]|uniref:Uncharacterized protein n=1 Tax=Solanum commersonii TaxID=4109 RepID=A0A9J5Z4B2_SOLCO|nr:hypothetical protein H5410_029303 [Solanum commersonii]
MEPIGHHGQNDPFTRSNDPRRREAPHFADSRLWSKLVTTAKTSNLHGQTTPGVGKPLILPIFVCYIPRYFIKTHNSDVFFSKNLYGPHLRP